MIYWPPFKRRGHRIGFRIFRQEQGDKHDRSYHNEIHPGIARSCATYQPYRPSELYRLTISLAQRERIVAAALTTFEVRDNSGTRTAPAAVEMA